jgi:NADH-quinone oxidoreductase subunit G
MHDDDLYMPVVGKAIVAPSQFANACVQIAAALADAKGAHVLPRAPTRTPRKRRRALLASRARQGRRVFLGNFAVQHPDYATLHALAQQIATLAGGRFGVFGDAANCARRSYRQGIPAVRRRQRAHDLRDAPSRPICCSTRAGARLRESASGAERVVARELVVACRRTSYRASEYADVLLPIAPFTETPALHQLRGSPPRASTASCRRSAIRAGVEGLRVLGNLLDLPGFDFDSSEAVRDAVLSGRSASELVATMRCALAETETTKPAGSSGSPTCRSITPIRWCAVRCRCNRPLMHAGSADDEQRDAPADGTRGRRVRALPEQDGGEAMLSSKSTSRFRPIACAARGAAVRHRTWARRRPPAQRSACSDRTDRLGRATLGTAWPLVWTIVKIAVIVLPLTIAVAMLTYWERKVIGWMQVRIGPTRRPLGLLQPFADVIKLC